MKIANRQSRVGSLTSFRDFPRCSHRCTLCTCVHASITCSPPRAARAKGEAGGGGGVGGRGGGKRAGGGSRGRRRRGVGNLTPSPPVASAIATSPPRNYPSPVAEVWSIDRSRPTLLCHPSYPPLLSFSLSYELPLSSSSSSPSFCLSFADSCVSYFSPLYRPPSPSMRDAHAGSSCSMHKSRRESCLSMPCLDGDSKLRTSNLSRTSSPSTPRKCCSSGSRDIQFRSRVTAY